MRSRPVFLVCLVAPRLAVTCAEAQGRNVFVEVYGSVDSEVVHCVIDTENGDFVATGYWIDGTDRDPVRPA